MMQPPVENLAPPKDDPFTPEELAQYDGSDTSKPIYVAIKGTVFDVTRKADVYGAGKSYNIFAGKDGSKGLGMSSLKPEHAIADYSDLGEKERKVLDDWYSFFEKRYNIVGRVVPSPSL
ncbi:progesterone binding protein [Coprinopsis cinerea okayama7|uniref:Progesterone binding protein n=1 Tax=Coprinopsis cinerea (strain Okayama-7 / 130 / ATCC MYA-4618 / FGSC 9003) TaxID=240176 RepID=A8NSB5_COPC7|nr:progesterone binding protein [Coprinopsis cinerea okayama7\|eukprot:XP_001835971.2 progesterone binding protein [Coprinopsis cinerea okayama7\